MGGLFSGLLGGIFIGAATIIGALTIIFQDSLIDEENFIERRLELFLGFVLLLTAFNFISPTWDITFSFVSGMFFILFSKRFIERTNDLNFSFHKREENRVALLLFLILIKNIPEGLAAGAAMNISHAGLSYSLLSIIILNSLFQGGMAAVCFRALGLDPILSTVGAMFIAIVGLGSSAFGGYMSKGNLQLISNILAFSGGAMMSRNVQEALSKVKVKSVNPTLVSGVVVTLILIIWKELL